MFYYNRMDSKRKRMRRQQLDRQLMPLVGVLPVAAPSGGWIKAIREALGMSLDALGRRLGLGSRSTVYQLERAEVEDAITVRRLRAAADALGCDLVVVFVPRVPLTQMMENKAREKAIYRFQRAAHSMVMEDQAVYQMDELIKEATQEILNEGDSKLWE